MSAVTVKVQIITAFKTSRVSISMLPGLANIALRGVSTSGFANTLDLDSPEGERLGRPSLLVSLSACIQGAVHVGTLRSSPTYE